MFYSALDPSSENEYLHYALKYPDFLVGVEDSWFYSMSHLILQKIILDFENLTTNTLSCYLEQAYLES